VTTKKSASKPSAKQLVEVTLRRLGKPVGEVPAGRFILVINPKVFGSTGDNWLGGVKATFESRDAALAGAAKLGGRVA
jgi:hypothetical protein